jgi:hemerythrin-like domain-containing protein
VSNVFPGHSAPAVGFEAPIEMLAACHLRVEAQCATLRRLVSHLGAHGADRQARDAASAVMRYFDTSARHHHADEEEDLFPALIESMAGSDAVCVRDLTVALIADHRELEHRWRRLRGALEQVASGNATALAAEEVQTFISLYERHIAREESELLPMAKRLLGDAELDQLGLAMRARRDPVQADPADRPPERPTSDS